MREAVARKAELEKLTTSMDPQGERWNARASIAEELQQVLYIYRNRDPLHRKRDLLYRKRDLLYRQRDLLYRIAAGPLHIP